MLKLFNEKVLYLISAVFFIFIAVKVLVDYGFSTEREYDFAKKEAQVLNTYVFAYRDYYQQLFINKIIPLNKSSVEALPAYSSSFIANDFSKKNKFDIVVRTVSDRARNIKNSADNEELKAIKYFKEHKNSKEYFKKNNDFYQYASVFRIEKNV